MVYEDEAVNNVFDWFSAGDHQFQVLGKDVPPDLANIAMRYRKAVTKEKIWFAKYKEDNKDVSPLPYHPKFGITDKEYDRLNNEYPNLGTKVTDTKKVTVIIEGNTIRFKGEPGFAFLDLIEINKDLNKVLIDSMTNTQFIGQVYEDSAAIGNYSGYKWKYERGNLGAVKELRSSNYYSVEVTLAKSVPDNKTLIIIKVLLIERMVTRFDNTISGYLEE